MTGHDDFPPLPHVRTLDGYVVDTSTPVWRVPTPIGLCVFNFSSISGMGSEFRAALMQFVAYRLVAVSPSSAYGDLVYVRRFLSTVTARNHDRVVEEVTWADFRAFEENELGRTRSVVHGLGATLRAWDRLGAAGLAADLRERLPRLEAGYEPNPSPVRTRCPFRGALTLGERDEVMARLREDFEAGKIITSNYAEAALIMVLALRPSQVVALKVRDLAAAAHPSGASHTLRVTRVKQRRVRPGESYKTHRLTPIMGQLLETQRSEAVRWAGTRGMDPAVAPLFPRRPNVSSDSIKRPELPGWEGHARAGDLGQRFTQTMSSLGLRSARTGAKQRVTSLRARRTLATLHRAGGGSVAEVRGLLDHSSNQASLVYIEPNRNVMARVEAAMAADLRVISAAFGPLVASEATCNPGWNEA